MKNILLVGFLLCFAFGSLAKKAATRSSVQTSEFNQVMEVEGISTYQNADKSVRVVKRRQKTALKDLELDRKTLRNIAQARFKVLESLKIGFHDFNIINVSNAPVSLADNISAYVWSGSYKDKRNKVHFFREFITEGWTWNVYTDKRKDLKKALPAIQAIIRSEKK